MPEPILDLPGEIWKPVVGYEGLYEVSNMGRVKSLDRARNSKNGSIAVLRGKLMKQQADERRRASVQLVKDGVWTGRLVHRLVALAFIGPCPAGQQCCHNDGNAANNHAANLRWDTAAGNNADKKRHGTWQGCENNGAAKLTRSQVVRIRKSLANGSSRAKLARDFGVSWPTIDRIFKNRSWHGA